MIKSTFRSVLTKNNTKSHIWAAVLCVIFCIAAEISQSQNVGINTTGATPNPAAILDVSSTTQGMLIPRLPANPTGTATSLLYYNTTSGCFMFYNNSTWQPIACACTGVPTTPTVSGTSSTCASSGTGTYTASGAPTAMYYTWNVPSGATITSGQGTANIGVTFGGVLGNVTCNATNSCGTSSAGILTVSSGIPSILTQPVNANSCASSGTATFTVAATGASSYQWQVNSGGGFANVSGAVYSGGTTATLTITNPPVSMNGYQYQCIVTGTCSPAATSNTVTLSVYATYVPITITNSQASATSAGLQVMVTVNSTLYTTYGELSGLQNVEFTTGPGGTGTQLNAWIESGATSTSTSTVYWVNLGSTITIPASSSTTIYMSFASSPTMNGATGTLGEAPQLFGGGNYSTSYGQNDNGSLVFNYYTNFAGTATPAGWVYTYMPSDPFNNGLTIPLSNCECGNEIGYANAITSLPIIEDSYITSLMSGTNSGPGYEVVFWGAGTGLDYSNGNAFFNPYVGLQLTNGASTPSGWYIGTNTGNSSTFTMSTGMLSEAYTTSTTTLSLNYGALASQAIALAAPLAIGGQRQQNGCGGTWSMQYVRLRNYPPNNVLPTASASGVTCP